MNDGKEVLIVSDDVLTICNYLSIASSQICHTTSGLLTQRYQLVFARIGFNELSMEIQIITSSTRLTYEDGSLAPRVILFRLHWRDCGIFDKD